MGGSVDLNPSANFSLNPRAYRLVKVVPTTGSLKGLMVAANSFKQCGSHFMVIFNAGSFAFDLADNGGNSFATLQPAQIALVSLLNNSSVNGVWVAVVRAMLGLALAPPEVIEEEDNTGWCWWM